MEKEKSGPLAVLKRIYKSISNDSNLEIPLFPVKGTGKVKQEPGQ